MAQRLLACGNKYEIHLNCIQKMHSYLSVNTVCIHYKDYSVNVVQGYSSC
jgi:hypothetical protein